MFFLAGQIDPIPLHIFLVPLTKHPTHTVDAQQGKSVPNTVWAVNLLLAHNLFVFDTYWHAFVMQHCNDIYCPLVGSIHTYHATIAAICHGMPGMQDWKQHAVETDSTQWKWTARSGNGPLNGQHTVETDSTQRRLCRSQRLEGHPGQDTTVPTSQHRQAQGSLPALDLARQQETPGEAKKWH